MGFRLNAQANRSVRLRDGETAFVGELGGDHGAIRHWTRGEGVLAVEKGVTHYFTLDAPRGSGHGAGVASGTILAPMPGKIIAVEVTAGEKVVKGQKLLTLEAMKMEHTLTAPFDGTVAELNAAAGGQVQVDAVLVRIEEGED